MTLMPRGLLQDAPPLRTEFEARCDIARKKFPDKRDYHIQGQVRFQMMQNPVLVSAEYFGKAGSFRQLWEEGQL